MKHTVEIVDLLEITGRGTILVVDQSPKDFTVGDLVNEKYVITAIEAMYGLMYPPKAKNVCGLVVKKI
jgi:hypothetical protein